MIRKLHLKALCPVLLTVGLLNLPALAENWPTRPMIVVPFGAGGNTDMMARLAAKDLSQKFGQNFIVENRPNPGGVLGVERSCKLSLTATPCCFAHRR